MHRSTEEKANLFFSPDSPFTMLSFFELDTTFFDGTCALEDGEMGDVSPSIAGELEYHNFMSEYLSFSVGDCGVTGITLCEANCCHEVVGSGVAFSFTTTNPRRMALVGAGRGVVNNV